MLGILKAVLAACILGFFGAATAGYMNPSFGTVVISALAMVGCFVAGFFTVMGIGEEVDATRKYELELQKETRKLIEADSQLKTRQPGRTVYHNVPRD